MEIKDYESSRVEIQGRISKVKDKSDKLKLDYLRQEIKVERVRDENAKALKKEKQIRFLIRELE